MAAACNRWRCWVVAAAFAAVVLLSAFHVQPQLSDMPASLSGSDAAASVKSHITIEQAVAQAQLLDSVRKGELDSDANCDFVLRDS